MRFLFPYSVQSIVETSVYEYVLGTMYPGRRRRRSAASQEPPFLQLLVACRPTIPHSKGRVGTRPGHDLQDHIVIITIIIPATQEGKEGWGGKEREEKEGKEKRIKTCFRWESKMERARKRRMACQAGTSCADCCIYLGKGKELYAMTAGQRREAKDKRSKKKMLFPTVGCIVQVH